MSHIVKPDWLRIEESHFPRIVAFYRLAGTNDILNEMNEMIVYILFGVGMVRYVERCYPCFTVSGGGANFGFHQIT